MAQVNMTADGGLKNVNDDHSKQQDNDTTGALKSLSLSSQAIHADDILNNSQDVAPALHVSTTFRYTNNPDELIPAAELDPNTEYDAHIYSRETAPNTTRLEAILSTLLKGPAITYSSGLSAFHALLVLLNPSSISIGQGYHGCHGVISIHQKLTNLKKLPLNCDPSDLSPGDIVHIETPLNPTGKVTNIAAFAEKAHSRGAILTVDATFAPPPLQDPFAWGADIVFHSGTKYFGGHSDLLCGILAINPARAEASKWIETLKHERTYLGNVMGNMESWLTMRSIRTLEVRVERQVLNCGKLVKWLEEALHGSDIAATLVREEGDCGVIRGVVGGVEHGSLQTEDVEDGWILRQMPKGMGAVFAIVMKTEEMARRLPSKLRLFHHATSLGGVESLIEWRCMSDDTVDRRLMRVSVGIEGWEDLRDDLMQGFEAVAEQKV